MAVKTVVSSAMPAALPSWRVRENSDEACPVSAGELVAKVAAWVETMTWPMAIPIPSMSSRIHTRSARESISAMGARLPAVPVRPRRIRRRGPRRR